VALVSTQTLLLLSIGVSAYVGVFHAGLPGRGRAHRWLAAWSFASLVYCLARHVQITSTDLDVFSAANRLATAISPILIWTILRFVMELTGRRPAPRLRALLAGSSFAIASVSLVTRWAMSGERILVPDVFGVPVARGAGGPGMALIGVYVGAGWLWVWHMLGAPSSLSSAERSTLRVGLSLYALAGVSTVLSSLGWLPVNGLADLGPVVVSIAASQLIVGRQRDAQTQLTRRVERQALALRESEERFRSLVENAPIGVLICDRGGDLVTVNRRALEMGGSPEAPWNLLTSGVLQACGFSDVLREALASGRAQHGEGRYTSAAGRSYDARVLVAPRRDASGEITGALALIDDVTERRSVEGRLRQAQKMEAVGQLASGLAHEINDPMAYVRANLAALREEGAVLRKQLASREADELAARVAEMEQLLEESAEGVERTIAIVRDMRELSDGGRVARERVELRPMLEGVLRMAAARRGGGAQLVSRFDEVPSVHGNLGQLRQVFLNLVVNALQAIGERGRVEIETLSEGGQVCVRVSDDGPGVAAEHRERLFEPFFTTKPAGEGTGLGLFLSYQIVQSHGGEIRVDASPSGGARFEVRLPPVGESPTP
jgi:PAS domain S-box-containing protein